MAHEISNVGFGDEVFTAGKPAWHGLGRNVREAVTSAEAMKMAGMDWKVLEAPLYGMTRPGTPDKVEGMTFISDKKLNYREDAEGKAIQLGVVGDGYVPIQNSEAFEFMDGLIGEGAARYETAGAIKQGRRVWMMAQLPGALTVGSAEDQVRKYLLLCNGHDGGMALRAFFTPIRVVCANTLRAALNGKEGGVTLRHTGGIKDKLAEARRVLGLATKHYEDLGAAFNRFYQEAMSLSAAEDYFKAVVPDNSRAENKARTENIRGFMLNGFKAGRGASIAGRTLWGAYNAVSEYADHTKFERQGLKAESADGRFESIMLGSSGDMTARAFEIAARVVGVN